MFAPQIGRFSLSLFRQISQMTYTQIFKRIIFFFVPWFFFSAPFQFNSFHFSRFECAYCQKFTKEFVTSCSFICYQIKHDYGCVCVCVCLCVRMWIFVYRFIYTCTYATRAFNCFIYMHWRCMIYFDCANIMHTVSSIYAPRAHTPYFNQIIRHTFYTTKLIELTHTLFSLFQSSFIVYVVFTFFFFEKKNVEPSYISVDLLFFFIYRRWVLFSLIYWYRWWNAYCMCAFVRLSNKLWGHQRETWWSFAINLWIWATMQTTSARISQPCDAVQNHFNLKIKWDVVCSSTSECAGVNRIWKKYIIITSK